MVGDGWLEVKEQVFEEECPSENLLFLSIK